LEEADIAHRSEDAELVPARAISLTVRRDQRVGYRVSAPDELDGPLAAGTRVGSVSVLVDGRVVRRVALLTRSDVPGAGTVRVVVSALGVPLTVLLLLAILLAAAVAALRIRVRLRLVR
jgi:D-alanyl-D-alanine carboxypeptidase (penicillin-binding protein 5/6)